MWVRPEINVQIDVQINVQMSSVAFSGLAKKKKVQAMFKQELLKTECSSLCAIAAAQTVVGVGCTPGWWSAVQGRQRRSNSRLGHLSTRCKQEDHQQNRHTRVKTTYLYAAISSQSQTHSHGAVRTVNKSWDQNGKNTTTEF